MSKFPERKEPIYFVDSDLTVLEEDVPIEYIKIKTFDEKQNGILFVNNFHNNNGSDNVFHGNYFNFTSLYLKL